mmetsp:Transcript_33548/g.61667  ORF Transcript_33548/g.61667 Transcript_33548/m.61667 type:complete len:191 (+) Transcript_33548:1266-1838(+)|eukprot:CAMPEP_0201607810 /NCGR_PEP_ID=MMETSP0492-20130828/6790_1 /ASSEMBLY_ACC=CAM_ASM_000837 /TAXON_ID=420259 /ORGANISM="Thalassiosira gravida, Strain GMp14c1" /LENGTH=190 /DNA_ID=CAMNT_0048072473 /DNA_START=115 /DNA_END=687 /DNA_ORIENTATION=-
MSRRSSRRQQAVKPAIPPNIERGLTSLVDGNEILVASMLSIKTSKKNDDDADDDDKATKSSALVTALADCMTMNHLSAEALLGRFFTSSVLSAYCIAVLGVSGKGNEATLAARIGKKWSRPDFVATTARNNTTAEIERKKETNENAQTTIIAESSIGKRMSPSTEAKIKTAKKRKSNGSARYKNETKNEP